jgi:hypothetical protein
MWRVVVVLAVFGACTPAQAPTARRIGMVMSISGVAALVGSALASPYTDNGGEMVALSSLVTVAGMLIFAGGELNDTEPAETLAERNHRWAKILAGRAQGAARDGRCPRVRRLAVRIRGYDREIHDFVLLRDPEVLKCLEMQ